MIPAWVNKYLLLEYEELGRGPKYDCWGFVRLIRYDRGCGWLPDFSDNYRNCLDRRVSGLIVRNKVVHWRRVEQPKSMDLVLMYFQGLAVHIGLMVSPEYFTHMDQSAGPVCVQLKHSPLKVEGVYREFDKT